MLSTYIPLFVMPLFLALTGLVLVIAIGKRFPVLGRRVTSLVLIVLTIFSLPVTSSALLGSLEKRYPVTALAGLPNADAVLFLAGATEPPMPPRQEAELGSRGDRLLLAARLMKSGKAPLLFISGGRGEARGEPDYSVEILREWGVDVSHIVTERDSHDTKSSAAAMAILLDQKGIDSILLVTSAYHMPRAMRLFGNLASSVVPVTANHFMRLGGNPGLRDWIPNAFSLSGSTLALHEYLGMLELTLRGALR